MAKWGGKRNPPGGKPRIDEKAVRERISFTLPPTLIRKLERKADKEDKSRSQIIVDILEAYFDRLK